MPSEHAVWVWFLTLPRVLAGNCFYDCACVDAAACGMGDMLRQVDGTGGVGRGSI